MKIKHKLMSSKPRVGLVGKPFIFPSGIKLQMWHRRSGRQREWRIYIQGELCGQSQNLHEALVSPKIGEQLRQSVIDWAYHEMIIYPRAMMLGQMLENAFGNNKYIQQSEVNIKKNLVKKDSVQGNFIEG